MTDQQRPKDTSEGDQRTQRIAYGLGAVKWIFVLALIRLFAGPMTKDLFNNELLPMPTWEWSLCSLTPGILVFLCRRPSDWRYLSSELTILKWALRFYLIYGLAFALFQGVWVLWIAVAASISGLVAIWKLEQREPAHAG
ncbi:hypothetical protein DI272_27155 [Streptomyces sp. Act143]|uniref:hypothetical protein n=1 Tax=Streptomyces sp. Act143 TaxID=2200760 RepID=UPI000D680901|nr:hypothetical protein [Streptomyces sp. Act143]PWI17427.1 hypothetical protein DI272_27155 [Streptomyces sp. Act143]